MNHIDSKLRATDDNRERFTRMDLNIPEMVTDVTLRTFGRRARAIAGPIAYLDKGADLYDAFKRAHENSATNEEKELFVENRQAIAEAIKDTERAIVIGVGPLEYFKAQELLILQQPQLKNLKEIVLIDVSADFLTDALKETNDLLNAKKSEEKQFKKFVTDSQYQVELICDDYKNVAERMATNPEYYFKDKKQTTVFVTGGLFGNLENPDPDAFPVHAIQEEEAAYAKIGGVGSKILASYFYKAHNNSALNYYQTPELSKFFLNIPKIIYDNCIGLEDFLPTPDNFSYVARWNESARYIEHRLKVMQSQRPSITINGQTRIFDLRKDDEFVMMTSGRFEPVRLSEIPSHNTGLTVNRTFMGQEMALQLFYTQNLPNDITFSPSKGNAGMANGALNNHSYVPAAPSVQRQVNTAPSLTDSVKNLLRGGKARFIVGANPVPAIG